MTPKSYRSNLSGIIPTKIDTEEIKKRGWQHDGILVVKEDDTRLGWPEKQFVNQIGSKLYGKRKEISHDQK